MKALLLLCSVFAFTAAGTAATRYVDAANSAPAAPYLSWTNAATTIQDAIDVAVAGDTILVTNGVYNTGGRTIYGSLTNRVAVNKQVAVQSVNGPLVTLIAGRQAPGSVFGDSAVRGVYLTNGASLSGFTVTNGATRSAGSQLLEMSGGGIWCDSIQASVSNCIVAGNVAPWFGGGAFSGTFNNCIFIGNAATNSGGGACSNMLNNCTVAGNSSLFSAGGVSGAIVKNCIVYGNTGQPANYSGSFFFSSLSAPLPSGSGNITGDPLFLNFAVRNLRLQSNSPCIGAGNNAYAPTGLDLDNNPRISDGTVDLGAYEFQGTQAVVAPYIISQPTNQTVQVGDQAIFITVAGGTAPAYQWRFGGNPMAGATSNILVLPNVQYSNQGFYSLFISNSAGTILSSNALLVVTNSGPLPEAVTRYVNLNNLTPASPFTNWASAAVTIQQAVDVSLPGDIILVTNGVYSAGGKAVFGLMTNRVVVDRPVSLRSVNGPQFTTIQGYQVPTTNGDGAIRCVYLASGASLSGFTLAQGATRQVGDLIAERAGGAVLCESWSSAISNCVVTASSASAYGEVHGGALYNCVLTNNRVGASSAFLSNCLVAQNWEASIYQCTADFCTITTNGYGPNSCTVNHSLILGNHGSGADFSTVNNSVLAGNSGGGRGNAFGSTLRNCTLVGDPSTYYSSSPSSSVLTNCIVYYTFPVGCTLSYCCTWPFSAPGDGNLSLDPKLVNAVTAEFHLQSSSPCINAGNNNYVQGTLDLDGNPRVFGGTLDMGAYEFQGPPTPSAPYFLAQPQPATLIVYAGTTVNYSASVYGTAPLSYQWNFAGAPLPGATNSLLVLTNAQVSQSGEYFLTVTNIAGSTNSSIVSLTVNPAPVAGFHYVDPNNSSPEFPYTNWPTAATNIQTAIDASQAGDEILVTNGIYATGERNGNRIDLDRAVTVRSVNGPLFTVIDGGGAVRGVNLAGGAKLIGFTVTNGYASSGAGVLSLNYQGGVVQNCILVGNQANPLGGGYGGGASGGTLNNCLIARNSASQGGGVYFSLMNSCTVVSNTATWDGGGIWSTNGVLNNCIIYYNVAPNGSNWSGSGFRAGPAYHNFCCTMPGQYWDITNAPEFVDLVGGNYRLQSNSPCINAGTNFYLVGATDLDGRPRMAGPAIDIGAYEFQPDASGAFIGWLQQNGLATDGSDDHSDPDGDHLDNWQEYVLGCRPWIWDNLTVKAGTNIPGSGLQLLVWGQPGHSYTLLSSSNLSDWTPLTQVDCVSSNGLGTAVDPQAAAFARRFYRAVSP